MPDQFPSNILCPVDFSELSAAALLYAAALSSSCGAQVTALHTYRFEVPPYFTPGRADAIKAQYREVAGEARAALEAFAKQSGAAVSEFLIEEGDPATVVMRTARDRKADLIVMGTHGRGGWQRVMLGSVAELVLRHSAIPVLTVRGTHSPQRLSRIVCPVNNSEASRKAFRIAARLAVCFDAELTVVHVEESEPKRPIGDLCAWIAEGERPKCTVQDLRRQGSPAEEILELAHTVDADLLVIGTEHKAFFDSTVLGSTTVRVVRHAACPVLTVAEGLGGKDVVSASFQQAAR